MQKKSMWFTAIVTCLIAVFLTACDARPPAPTPQQIAEAKAAAQREKEELAIKNTEILESYRAITVSNAETSARTYRDSNPRLTGMKIITHPDLMMTADCLQGSGWIWVSFMGEKNEKTKEVEKYKAYCSTYSAQTGCFLEKDFNETAFAKELKQCNRGIKLPHKSFTG